MNQFIPKTTIPDYFKSIVLTMEVGLIILVMYALWYRLFLPYIYIFAALFLAGTTSVLVLKNGRMRNVAIASILLVFMLVRNVYYLGTQDIVPFGDAVWDYGVVRSFLDANRIYVIKGVARATEYANAGTLTWYSGWPLLHIVGAMFTRVTGIDPFYLFITVPVLLSVTSFAVVYIILEKVRRTFGFGKQLTTWGMLIYAMSPDSVYYSMQFTHQNIGTFLFFVILYLLYSMVTDPSDRRYRILIVMFTLSLVIAHHYTSLILLLSLVLLFGMWTVSNYFGQHAVQSRILLPFRKLSLSYLILLATAFLYLWVDSYGSIIYPSVTGRLDRLLEILRGAMRFEFFSAAATYPASLTPAWAIWLLHVRDFVMYAPAVLGLLVIWAKRNKTPERSFLVYYTLILGFLLISFDTLFKLEPFRVIMLGLPLVAAFVPIGFGKLRSFVTLNVPNKLRPAIMTPLRNTLPAAIIVLLVFSSFVGLYGHDFASIHLYDPNVSSVQVGERSPDHMIADGFLKRVPVDDFRVVFSDDIDQLIFLLKPTQYDMIRRFPVGGPQELAMNGTQLVVSFKDFYMYLYYGNVYTPIGTPDDARTIQTNFTQCMNAHAARLYDDGVATVQILDETNQTAVAHS
jgi:hypothetical protein